LTNIATPELTLGPYWKSIGEEAEKPKANPKGKKAAPKRKGQAVYFVLTQDERVKAY